MKGQKLTEEQVHEFWAKRGFLMGALGAFTMGCYKYPDGTVHAELPSMTQDNIDKWPVVKASWSRGMVGNIITLKCAHCSHEETDISLPDRCFVVRGKMVNHLRDKHGIQVFDNE